MSLRGRELQIREAKHPRSIPDDPLYRQDSSFKQLPDKTRTHLQFLGSVGKGRPWPLNARIDDAAHRASGGINLIASANCW